MYHALSLVLTGTETYTDLMRLLATYALSKYKQEVLRAVQDANPTHAPANIRGVHAESIRDALNVSEWGTGYHLFALSLLFDRPILAYGTIRNPRQTFLGVTTVEQLADCFRSFVQDSQDQLMYCTNVHEALLSNGDVSALPHLPIALFNAFNTHWVAMLLSILRQQAYSGSNAAYANTSIQDSKGVDLFLRYLWRGERGDAATEPVNRLQLHYFSGAVCLLMQTIAPVVPLRV